MLLVMGTSRILAGHDQWPACTGTVKHPCGATASSYQYGTCARKRRKEICTWCHPFELCIEDTFALCKLSDPSPWCTLATLCYAWFVVWWHCHLPTCINILSNMTATVSVAVGSTMQVNKFWQPVLNYASLRYVMKVKLFSFYLFWYLVCWPICTMVLVSIGSKVFHSESLE